MALTVEEFPDLLRLLEKRPIVRSCGAEPMSWRCLWSPDRWSPGQMCSKTPERAGSLGRLRGGRQRRFWEL